MVSQISFWHAISVARTLGSKASTHKLIERVKFRPPNLEMWGCWQIERYCHPTSEVDAGTERPRKDCDQYLQRYSGIAEID